MKSREEQLTWAKQRALICVDMGRFSDAVAFLRADLDANPLTKGVVSSGPSHARIQGGDGRGARPELASADRVDRRPRVATISENGRSGFSQCRAPGRPRQAFGSHANASEVI